MQFTYSFPTGFTFLYLVQQDATRSDGPYSPGSPTRTDTWKQWSRWRRGLFGGTKGTLVFKWFNFVICLAALATAGLGKSITQITSESLLRSLGIYGSGLSIKAAFNSAAATSFGCTAPV